MNLTIAGLQEWLNKANVGNRPPPSPTELSLTKSPFQPEVSCVLNWRNWRQRWSTSPIFSSTSPAEKKIYALTNRVIYINKGQIDEIESPEMLPPSIAFAIYPVRFKMLVRYAAMRSW